MRSALLVRSCLLAIAAAQSANARGATLEGESANAGQVADIVVTAERRSESMQRVPITMVAVTAERLDATAIGQTEDLQAIVPGLVNTVNLGYAAPFLRGVGSTFTGAGDQPPVATYVDGVYYAASPTSVFSLVDIERIEVLKGPQGTLFGRNATGGVIQVITKDPTARPQAEASLSYGNYDSWRGTGYISGGSEQISASLGFQIANQGDGYGKNFFNGKDTYRVYHDNLVRGKLMIKPNDDLTIRILGDYGDRKDSSFALRLLKGYKPLIAPSVDYYSSRPWDIDQDTQPKNSIKGGGGSVQIDYDFGNAKIVNITAYRESLFKLQGDGDEYILPVISAHWRQKDKQFSNELQIRSTDNGDFTWIAGLFYIDTDARLNPHVTTIGPPFLPLDVAFARTVHLPGKSTALFGQAGWRFTPATRLTVGLRYTWDKRRREGVLQSLAVIPFPDIPIGGSLSQKKLTWRLALDHQFTDRIMGYVSFNRGFKGGGFNALDTSPGFLPETLNAYETGLKTSLADGRLRLNASAFLYQYKNLQVSFSDLSTGSYTIQNAAKAKVYGFDLDSEALVSENLTLFGSLEYLHSKYTKYPEGPFYIEGPAGGFLTVTRDLSGHTLPFSPKLAFNFGATLSKESSIGLFSMTPMVSYSSSVFASADNVLKQGNYAMLNATLNWKSPDEHYRVSIWGRNLTNRAILSKFEASPTGAIGTFKPPRTYGITLSARY
ncbi:MAG TPA: TonB-dependent receptor [Allosphingosinicella sp.]|nr:TonB-dependent receptor [Allosphingosinicella sp.]